MRNKNMLILLLCLICFILILGVGCGSKTKASSIPKDLSEVFYQDMLKANELIQKSIDAKYNYLLTDFGEKLGCYYLINEDKIEEVDKDFIQKNNIDIDRKLTHKEKTIIKSLINIESDLNLYNNIFDNDNFDNKYKKELLEKILDRHKQFKTLLEIEEPK